MRAQIDLYVYDADWKVEPASVLAFAQLELPAANVLYGLTPEQKCSIVSCVMDMVDSFVVCSKWSRPSKSLCHCYLTHRHTCCKRTRCLSGCLQLGQYPCKGPKQLKPLAMCLVCALARSALTDSTVCNYVTRQRHAHFTSLVGMLLVTSVHCEDCALACLLDSSA